MSHRFDDLRLDDLRQRRSMKWRMHPADVLPMHVAELDFPLAEPIRAGVAELLERGDTGYVVPLELPETYATFAAARYGQQLDPARCFPIGDVMQGVYAALRSLTGRGAGVVICPPVYHPFFATIGAAGRQVVSVPLILDAGSGKYDLDLAGLDRAFADGAAALLLCSPHNPIGRLWSAAELSAVAEVADQHGVLVLSDEIHAPMTYDTPFVPFATLDCGAVDRSITFVSASKAWNLPGLKCALAVPGSPPLAEHWAGLPELIGIATSIFGVAAGSAAFRSGTPWLDDTLGYLDGNRRLLAELLAQRLPDVRYRLPEATYLAWLDCRALGLGPDPSQVFLDRGRVALVSGLRYGPEGAGFARLNLGTSRALVAEGVDRMATAIGR